MAEVFRLSTSVSTMEPQIYMSNTIEEHISRICDRQKIDVGLKKELKEYKTKKTIPFRLVKEIHALLSESDEEPVYLHELIQDCDIFLPSPPVIPRNPELEERCKRLRAEQENKHYKEMVKNVDRTKRDYFAPGNDIKEINRQIVSVFNFLVTVGGAFAFGYKATEYSLPSAPHVFGLQLIAGLTLATVVFFADLYFLLREAR